MIVTFCGHSQLTGQDVIAEKLKTEFHTLLQDGYRNFYLGGYGDFDILAAVVLEELKTDYPDMERLLILPYPDKKVDVSLYDGTLYPPLENVPKRYAISRRNKWMVEQASVMVAYVDHDWGGAAKMLDQAVKKGLQIINLGGV